MMCILITTRRWLTPPVYTVPVSLQIAIKVDGRNPLARFERAAVLEDQGRLQEALSELLALKACVSLSIFSYTSFVSISCMCSAGRAHQHECPHRGRLQEALSELLALMVRGI